MKTIKFFMYAFFVAFLSLTSCSTDGEDGENGIQGVPGTDGQDGIDGMDGTNGESGEDGEDGEDGNANIISSDWIEYDNNLWSNFIIDNGINLRLYPVEISDLTAEMTNTAAILMYSRFTIGSSFILPFTTNITGLGATGAQELSFQPRRNGGGIDIRMTNSDLIGDPGTFGAGNVYRYVIIPAPEGRAANFSPEAIMKYYEDLGVDFSNYQSVEEYFNLR